MAQTARYVHRVRYHEGRLEVAVTDGVTDIPNTFDWWNLDVELLSDEDKALAGNPEWVWFGSLNRNELRRVAKYCTGIDTLPRDMNENDMRRYLFDYIEHEIDKGGKILEDGGVHRVFAPEPIGGAHNSAYNGGVTSTVTSTEPEPSSSSSTIADTSGMDVVFGSLFSHIGTLVDERVRLGLSDVVSRATFDDMSAELRTLVLAEVANLGVPRPVHVMSKRDPAGVTMVGTHYLYEKLLQRSAVGLQQFFFGHAGTGKTFLAIQIAKGLALQYRLISATADMMRHDLFGFRDAHGNVASTALREALTHGMMLIIDEVDNAGANLMGGLNLLTSHDEIEFPDGIVKKHPDFRLIVIGNTIGEGATSKYRGRNALDAAFLDRFTYANIELDESIETAGVEARLDNRETSARWLRLVRTVRRNATEHNLNVNVTPRASFDGATLLQIGEDMRDATHARLLRGCTHDIAVKLLAGTEMEGGV